MTAENLLTHEQILQYLDRIGLSWDEIQPTVCQETLIKLHRHHTTHVPFENISTSKQCPQNREKEAFPMGPSLKVQDLFQKIVVNKRGGYCFEMNGIFGAVLRSLGYKVTNGAAKAIMRFMFEDHIGLVPVAGKETMEGEHKVYAMTPYSHMMLFVTWETPRSASEHTWLVDVGYGGIGMNEPIPIDLSRKETKENPYCIRRGLSGTSKPVDAHPVQDGIYPTVPGFYLQRRLFNGELEDIYYFTMAEFYLEDYEGFNFWIAHNPQGLFVHSLLLTKINEDHTRYILFDMSMKKKDMAHATIEKIEFKDEEERRAMAEKLFGLKI